VKLQQVVADAAVVSLGNGANDRLDMLAVTAMTDIVIDGGAGKDTVTMTEVEAVGVLDQV
jgi:hypothetical protein